MAARLTLFATLVALAVPSFAAGQDGPIRVGHEVFVGSEVERYLRLLQNTGRVPSYPWTVRGFSPGEVESLAPSDSIHPWAGRYEFTGNGTGLEAGWIRPRAGVFFNSAFSDVVEGPVWAGRGVTGTVQAGFHGRFGPLSLVLAPVAFLAQNREFELAPTGLPGDGAYQNPATPNHIDLPQRFGDEPYGRIDPGSSTLRLDLAGVALGISTASLHWGPAERNPLVLGSNAGGFAHAFAGSSRPVDIWIGELHGRLLAGRLQQSPFSPVRQENGERMMSGLVFAFMPRGVEGLEVGLSRFFHAAWPEGRIGAGDVFRPLESFWKTNLPDEDMREPSNQLASVFFRWNFPASGLEIGAEYMREDHSYDLRTFLLEPDDLRGYVLALTRVWQRAGGELGVLRAEVMNSESSHRLRLGSRPEFERRNMPLYIHWAIRQGHTQHGKLLASPYGHGGAASLLGADRYDSSGRLSLEWERAQWRDRTTGLTAEDAAEVDVVHSLGIFRTAFRGPTEITAGVRGTYNFNRNLQANAFNLNVTMSGSYAF